MKTTLRIERYNPESRPRPSLQDYELEATAGATVLDCLMRVKDELDPSLAFRRSCRSAICGSCAMNINGVNRLACYTQMTRLKTRTVLIRPLPALPRIKDLVVDMEPFMEKYRVVRPFIVPKEPPPEKEYLQTIRERKRLDEIITCIMCGCCSTACPVTWTNSAYLGPAALGKVYRFSSDSRDTLGRERLRPSTRDYDGAWRCHHIANCVEVCPKKIDLPWVINELRKRAL